MSFCKCWIRGGGIAGKEPANPYEWFTNQQHSITALLKCLSLRQKDFSCEKHFDSCTSTMDVNL